MSSEICKWKKINILNNDFIQYDYIFLPFLVISMWARLRTHWETAIMDIGNNFYNLTVFVNSHNWLYLYKALDPLKVMAKQCALKIYI